MAVLNQMAHAAIRNPKRRYRYVLRCMVTLLCLSALTSWEAPVCDAGAQQPTEYEIKVAFIYKFISFVEWPSASFPEEETPIRIGVLGDDPFGTALDKLVKEKSVRQRKLEAKRSKDPSDLVECHIVFVAKSHAGNIKSLSGQFHEKHILTIGDSPGFAENGGIINLIEREGKIRFEISTKAAKAAEIRISSQLLDLAKVVESTQEEGDHGNEAPA
jgi:hypothetical protein